MGVFRDAVQRLYQELGPRLLTYARSILHDASDAEDAVQHVFLKLISRENDGLPRESRPYLFRAVRNACLNRTEDGAPGDATRRAPPMFTGPAGLEGLAHDVEEALRDLPAEQREVVVLSHLGVDDAGRGREHPG